MGWSQEYLDVILVPMGLLIMLVYHLILLYRCLRLPQTTVFGYENHNKRAWVERMMQVEAKDIGPAITVISSNISAATSLSSISLALCSLIGAWIGSSSQNIFTNMIVYGNTGQSIISIKYITILACFLVAFGSFVQTTRNYVHASFLISMPNNDIPVNYIEKAIIRGSNFWTAGMRALYFAINLLLWIFGPIPMFVCSVIMVVVLHQLDTNSTPLHEYQPIPSHNIYKKIGQETTAFAGEVDYRSSPHGNGCGPSTISKNEQNLQF